MEKQISKKFFLIWIMVLFAANALMAATGPFEAFMDSFTAQSHKYVIPIIIFVVIAAAAIAYSRTKDWTQTLTVGAIAAGIIGGAITLGTMFSDFNFSTQ